MPKSDPTQQHAALTARLRNVEQLLVSGKRQEVATALNQLVREAPNDARVFLLGSRLAEATGHHQGMLQSAQRAHALAPGWVAGLIRLATVLTQVGRAAEGLKHSIQAIQLAPDSVEVLAASIDVARGARDYRQVQAWLEKLDSLKPGQVQVKIALARNLSALGQHEQALALFNDLVAAHSDQLSLRAERARLHILMGTPTLALEDGERLVDAEPENETYRFILAVANGEVPDKQPAAMIKSTFDAYAADFDQHLVVQLRYRLPKDVADRILRWHPDRQLNLLDIGCGTGLLGVCLGKINGAMVGVDLSMEMLNKAAMHQLYDRLHNVDLVDALSATPPALYQVIAACDVLNYLGDLSAVIEHAYRVLVPDGRFVFSIETTETPDKPFTLEPSTLRYTHNPEHIRALCVAAGFENVIMEENAYRQQKGEPIPALLVSAQRAAATAAP